MTHYLIEGGLFLALWVTGVVTGWAWCSARRQRLVFDAQIARAEGVLADRQAGRHAKGGPLPAPARVREPNPPSPGRASRPSQPSRTVHTTHAPRIGPTQTGHATAGNYVRPLARAGQRRLVSAVQASDLPAPVIWPEPGTHVPMRPQPPRTSGAGTQTMPRLTDTGELRALATAWEEKTRREQAVWSHEYALRCEADRQEAGLTP